MLSELAMKVVRYVAALLALVFVGGGLVLQFLHTEITNNNLILIGIGMIIAIIPWMQSLHLGVDGIQMTTIRSSSAVIADNLQKTVEETKMAMEALQSQINKLKEEIASPGDTKVVVTTPDEDRAISQANDIYGVVSSAMSGVAALLKNL